MPAHNIGFAKAVVQCSAETFVVNQTLVFQIKFCGENRHLRQPETVISNLKIELDKLKIKIYI